MNFFEEYTLIKSSIDTVNKKPIALNQLASDHKNYPADKSYLVKASWIDISPKSSKQWGQIWVNGKLETASESKAKSFD